VFLGHPLRELFSRAAVLDLQTMGLEGLAQEIEGLLGTREIPGRTFALDEVTGRPTLRGRFSVVGLFENSTS
jgi:hypothetical protein